MKYWNGDAEWTAKRAGYDTASYEEACRDYATIVHERAVGFRKYGIAGETAQAFQCLSAREHEKHAAHDQVVSAIERNEDELRRLGLAPIFQGKLENGFVVSRQEAGKFAMEFCGYGADAEFAN